MTWIVQTIKLVYKLFGRCRVSLPCTIFDFGKKSCKWNYCTNVWPTRAVSFNYTTFDRFETFLRLPFLHFRFRQSRLIRKTDHIVCHSIFFNVNNFRPQIHGIFLINNAGKLLGLLRVWNVHRNIGIFISVLQCVNTYTNMVSSWWSGGANLKKSMCGQMFSQDNGHLILTKEDLQASLCVSVCLRARACTWLNNIRLSKKFTKMNSLYQIHSKMDGTKVIILVENK